MNFKFKPQVSSFSLTFYVLLACLLASCNYKTGESNSVKSAEATDSILVLIANGRKTVNPIIIRQENLVQAYTKAKTQKIDSIRLKYLTKIQWSFLNLKDSTWFRKTNAEANQLAIKINDSLRAAGAYWDLGIFFNNNAVKDSAFSSFYKAQKLFSLLGDSKRAGILLYEMAGIQADVKNYTGSEINLVKAIEIFKPLEEQRWLYNCYSLLGTVSKDLKYYERALGYYQIAAEYLEKSGVTGLRKNGLENNIGVSHLYIGNLKKAASYFESALKVDSLRFRSPSKYARTLNNLAQSKYLLNDHENIENMFLESIKLRDSIKDLSALAGSYFNLAEYYAYKKDTSKAIISAEKSKDFAKKSSNNSRLIESLELLTKIDHKNASDHAQNYIHLNDSLQQEERKIREKFARIRFETDEVVAQNKLLARQRQLWTGIAGAFLLLGVATFIILYQRAKNQKLRFEQEQQKNNEEIFNLMLAQSESVEEGKKLEQKRVSEELHDGVLGKMLGARMVLLGLNKKMDPASVAERSKAISVIQEIEGEVRSISHELSHAAYQKIHNFILSIKDLIKTIKGSSKINFDFNYPENLDWDALSGDIKINLYRIIQESIQNAVKHSSCKHIDINFEVIESDLNIAIQDDGKGFKIRKGKKGIGMRNIASRMKKLNGTWAITSEPNQGTKITLIIPIASNNVSTPSTLQEEHKLQEI